MSKRLRKQQNSSIQLNPLTSNHFLYRCCISGQMWVTILLPLRPFLSYMGSCLVYTLSLSFTIYSCFTSWCKATTTHHTRCILWKITRHKFPFQNKCEFTWTTSMFKTVKIQTTSISQWLWHIKHLSGSNVPGDRVVLVSIKCDTQPKADTHHCNMMLCHQRQIFKNFVCGLGLRCWVYV